MYVPFDLRSFWLNMYCLYHSVWLQGIEMKTNKGGGYS